MRDGILRTGIRRCPFGQPSPPRRLLARNGFSARTHPTGGAFLVQLNDRIVLSPFAAKRLWILLGAILKEYESRFGVLSLDRGRDGGGSK